MENYKNLDYIINLNPFANRNTWQLFIHRRIASGSSKGTIDAYSDRFASSIEGFIKEVKSKMAAMKFKISVEYCCPSVMNFHSQDMDKSPGFSVSIENLETLLLTQFIIFKGTDLDKNKQEIFYIIEPLIQKIFQVDKIILKEYK